MRATRAGARGLPHRSQPPPMGRRARRGWGATILPSRPAAAGLLLTVAVGPCAADVLPLERGRTELLELDNEDARYAFRYRARGHARVRVTIREPTTLLPSIPPVRFHSLHGDTVIVEPLPLGRVILDMTLVEGEAPVVWIRGPLRPHGAWAADVNAPATEIPDY